MALLLSDGEDEREAGKEEGKIINADERTALLPARAAHAPPQSVALGPPGTPATKPEENVSFWATMRSLDRGVVLFLLVALCNMLALQAVQPVLVLYLDFRGWTTASNVRFYSYLSATAALVPVPLNLALGAWVGRRGYREVVLCSNLLALLGFCGLALAREQATFAVAFGCVYILDSVRRTVCQAYIASVTTPQHRMRVMALVPLAVSIGAFSGPLVSLVSDYGPAATPTSEIVPVNTYTLVFLSSAGVVLFELVLLLLYFRPASSHGGASPSAAPVPPWRGRLVVLRHGRVHVLDPASHIRWCIVFFSLKVLLMNVSAGLYFVTLQPLLVHHFGLGQASMSRVTLLYCGLAVIPPLLMAGLASKVSSRSMMVWGGFLKLGGMLLYGLPLDNMWTLLVGYVLLLKGAIFVLTATITLFTQLVGRRCTPGMVGLLACMYATGMAVGAVVGGDSLVHLYGEWVFLAFSAGAAASAFMVLLPPWYQRLDPNAELVKLLNSETPPQP